MSSEMVTRVTPNFRILWTGAALCLSSSPSQNARIRCGYPLVVSPFSVVSVVTDDLLTKFTGFLT